MTKLLQFYENYIAECDEGSANSRCSALRWIESVALHYAPNTLCRLLSSKHDDLRRAAAWALSQLGDESHYATLGSLLRDPTRAVRTSADEARRTIAQRTQSPWHRRTVTNVEQLLAAGAFGSAVALASHLVEEAESRADAYMLRAWVLFSDGELNAAAEDCKKTLNLDPHCYQACVALGQCMWHLGRDTVARECYCEAYRIYPDWEPARAALQMLAHE
jgi:tetratricopeptide (TPR) repeat protein